MADYFNDNDAHDDDSAGDPYVSEPDAHGQAAYLLVESLIHSLVAQTTLSLDTAIEIVEVAADVQSESAAGSGDMPATERQSLAMLEALAQSLRVDRHG